MILVRTQTWLLGVALAILAAPACAAAPHAQPDTQQADGSEQASNFRRVELPFPIDIRTPERTPRTAPQPDQAGPHPFRETTLKRASLSGVKAGVLGSLSPRPEFG